jgi:hypothetical protein
MGITRLKRKELRRKKDIKLLTKLPVIKNIDVEAIKQSFAAKKA